MACVFTGQMPFMSPNQPY